MNKNASGWSQSKKKVRLKGESGDEWLNMQVGLWHLLSLVKILQVLEIGWGKRKLQIDMSGIFLSE